MADTELVALGLPTDTDRDMEQAAEGAPAEQESPPAPAPPGAPTADQLTRLRDVLIAAHPEAVPELIAGADLDTLLASLEPARAAYDRARQAATQAALAAIPRGGGTRTPDPAAYADLSPEAKIALALSVR